MFIDFSSAFNTRKHDIVINKLRTMNVSPIGLLCKFALDFLRNRQQRVRINDILSTVYYQSVQVHLNVVYSLLLFIIYTNELRSRFRNCHLIKINADDTVIVGLISNNDESEYNELISEVAFRHCNIYHVPLSIDNSIVEMCDNYFKYIGIT